jgi:protein gp37
MRPKRSTIGYVDFSGGDLNFVVRGTTPGDCEVSPGCAHCYALALQKRFGIGPPTTTVDEERLSRLVSARFEPGAAPFRRGPGSRPLAFVCDTGDLFHETVSRSTILQFLNLAGYRAEVDWLVLTKRPARMQAVMRWYYGDCEPPGRRPLPNLWLGVSVESPAEAEQRIPLLLETPAAQRWLSVEPMLGAIDLLPYIGARCLVCRWRQTLVGEVDRSLASAWDSGNACPRCGSWVSLIPGGIDWVVCGAESGAKRRPFSPLWAESLWAQCRRAGVPFFGKQDSGAGPGRPLYLRRDESSDTELVHEFPGGADA